MDNGSLGQAVSSRRSTGLVAAASTLGGLARLEGVTLGGLARLDRRWQVVLRSSRLVVVVHQALGLGLEDAQGTAAAASQLGQLGGTEEQHDDRQDDEQLGRAEVAIRGQHDES